MSHRPADLRHVGLSELRAIDFRAVSRDYWADEAAIHDRFVAVWAGLDDASWRLPGAAPSDAGGPDWSLLDHVGHVVDWWELTADYIRDVLAGADWPADGDFYEGGDFNALNERRRERFAAVSPAELRERGSVAHERAHPLGDDRAVGGTARLAGASRRLRAADPDKVTSRLARTAEHEEDR